MPLRLLLLFLLVLASSPSIARDLRQLGPGGDGGDCPEAAAGDDVAEPARTGKREPAQARPRSAVTRGGDNGSVRAPRWHSFLPGMFR